MLISFLSKRSYILAITYQYQIQTIWYKHKSFSYAIWQTVFITVLWNSENGRQQQQQLQQQRTASTECSPTFCACDPNLDRCQQGFPNNRTKPGSKWRTGSTHTVSNSALTHPYKTPTMRSQLPTSDGTSWQVVSQQIKIPRQCGAGFKETSGQIERTRFCPGEDHTTWPLAPSAFWCRSKLPRARFNI